MTIGAANGQAASLNAPRPGLTRWCSGTGWTCAGLALDVMLARSQALAVGEELVAERPPGRLLEASPRPALIWRAWSMIRPARQAARTVRLYLVAAAPADDDQEVLVNPGDLGAG